MTPKTHQTNSFAPTTEALQKTIPVTAVVMAVVMTVTSASESLRVDLVANLIVTRHLTPPPPPTSTPTPTITHSQAQQQQQESAPETQTATCSHSEESAFAAPMGRPVVASSVVSFGQTSMARSTVGTDMNRGEMM